MINKSNVEKNLKKYKRTLAEIKKLNLAGFDDDALKAMAETLKTRARDGKSVELLMPETFAVVFETVKRTMGLTPFDVQLLAAAAMASGRIIELPTGEGKTLVAVFVACLGALEGKGVHVLTFNDYLAKRDALWMKPVYDFLGLSVRYISEGMSAAERKEAYAADITYLTAKEAGFDYLRGFLAYDTSEVVQRPFNLAIIDEADSILIDEARIPLVIAGDMPSQVKIEKEIYQAVAALPDDGHIVMDEYKNNVALTDAGVEFIEARLGIDNLYEYKNIETLTKVNIMLQAVFLLKRDIHYIVRNGEVQLVDEFTGRIVKDRQWPDGLQAATEIKEGLTPKPQGLVMNRITLQSFLQFYPALCGMTGTASSAGPEFYEFYGKSVTVIPPNKPCARVDRPDSVYTNKNAKHKAIVNEIIAAHKSGRPVLVGTCSVEESEILATLLKTRLEDIVVLNAKNDEEEAEIIANAGRLSAVTISTNMAGRGVDIRLGGREAEEYDAVCRLGGLYVIGTSRYESVRINNQLRGRAGRQGDPGESRFFISLEDDLLVKYRINDYIRVEQSDMNRDEPLDDPSVNRTVAHIQKVAEGQTFDGKITLSKYSYVIEDQRKIIHKKRESILRGDAPLAILEKMNPEKVRSLLKRVSADEFTRAQKAIELYAINRCWADHLLFVEYVLDEVQVITHVRKDPFTFFNEKLIENFDYLENDIRDTITGLFDAVVIKKGHIDLEQMGVKGPSSTRTYMVNDGSEKQGLISATSAMVSPLYMFYLFVELWEKHVKRKNEKKEAKESDA